MNYLMVRGCKTPVLTVERVEKTPTVGGWWFVTLINGACVLARGMDLVAKTLEGEAA